MAAVGQATELELKTCIVLVSCGSSLLEAISKLFNKGVILGNNR